MIVQTLVRWLCVRKCLKMNTESQGHARTSVCSFVVTTRYLKYILFCVFALKIMQGI